MPAFRAVPRTGVIFVMAEAVRRGFRRDGTGWSNLGQGQPEIGQLPGAPPRISHIDIDEADHEYAPVAGLMEVREQIADLYNALYRHGMPGRYSAENVALCGGGRMALTRAVAALGGINLGHFLPDYTAYEELLGLFSAFNPIPILLDPQAGYHIDASALEREVQGRGLGGLLVSNPGNPTGRLVAGAPLADWVDICRRHRCALISDEFYSSYIWAGEADPQGLRATVSAAAHVERIETDPVLLLNGLTKSWRYPGWRLSWAVGPKKVIDAVTSAGSFLDGGCARPLQRAALPLLTPAHVQQETAAIQISFAPKRQLICARLRAMGVHVEAAPDGAFYVFGDLRHMPEGLKEGMDFFRAALAAQVICVPGEFFDINPGGRRPGSASRFRHHVRFSFGPSVDELTSGLDRPGRHDQILAARAKVSRHVASPG